MKNKESQTLAKNFRARRWEIGDALIESISDWDKYPEADRADIESRREFVRMEMLCLVDYLALFFETEDQSYCDLYIGEKLKQCYLPGKTAESFRERRRKVAESDRAILQAQMAPISSPEEMELLAAILNGVHQIITDAGKISVKILFVGDCLYLDVIAFLAGPLLSHGITIEPTYAASKNPVETRRFLLTLDGSAFDLVFYSPFTYEFHIEYSELFLLRTAAAGRERLRHIVEATQNDTLNTMRLLGEQFEAPVMVHNSANVRRHDGTLRERAKNLLTRRSRKFARQAINDWLPCRIRELNSQSFPHFFLLDEAALLKRCSEDRLGRLFYNSELQHPAEFGRAIAGLYQDAIVTQKLLAKKKVIVCDLDNTLWNGVIGEGAVSHYIDRQNILKALRNKGILLAINSKNNPGNVHWRGGVLDENDFVSSQINWQPKIANMRSIAADLNLKLKDFLFIDDRSDERAMVAEMLPEVQTLDADSPDVWRRLSLLAETLPEQEEIDRTTAYKQREQRQRFLEDFEVAAAEQRELFRKMNLKVTIRPAERKELKRVAELINRTNQFNMCGSRTTLKEVSQWQESPHHTILIVEAGDKFGDMGVVSVAVTAETADWVEIPVFVLSCRIFGYGVENALLNYVRREAGHGGGFVGKPVAGLFKETAHNEPCRRVYQENGFVWETDRWTFHHGPNLVDPDWLTVESPCVLMTV